MQAIFPTAYFGSIYYYQKMVQAENISLELFEHYIKQTLRNRMSVLGPNGIQHLTIPIIKPNGNKTVVKALKISHAENWQKVHWRTIESAYASSPYFEHYGPEVKELVFSDIESLVDFNLNIHKRIIQWLQLPIVSKYTTTYTTEDISEDLRNHFNEGDVYVDYQYLQVFSPNHQFEPGLSILDAIFNLGPMTRKLIVKG